MVAMNSIGHANGKKMKKRKELDALVGKPVHKRNRKGNIKTRSSGDKLLSDSTDEGNGWPSNSLASGQAIRCSQHSYSFRKPTRFKFLNACSAILIFMCIVSTATVMWLFVDVREQVTSFRRELNQVVAGNQGVPDALQKCHTVSKDLQKNQTLIMSRLNGFSLQLANFSSGMAEIKSGLRAVQDQLRSSPDLVNIPRLIEDLSTSVASFGSQIKDLNSTVSSLKDQNVNRDNTVGNLVNNLTEIKLKIKELSRNNLVKDDVGQKQASAEKEAIYAIINQISRNISNFNDTLSSKLQWTLEDQSKDHKLLESLREMSENLTSRVKTLETICAKENNSGSHLSPILWKTTVLPGSHFLFSEKQANKSDSIENG